MTLSSLARVLAPAAAVAAGVALGTAHAPAGPPGPSGPETDVEVLLREAQRVQREDLAAWQRFRFRRSVVTERLDEAGEAVGREDLEFELVPAAEGFDEWLTRIDGRAPSPAEVNRHRRKARFSRHYETARRGEGSGAEGGGYSLQLLLKLSSYRHAGLEPVDGVPCHRLDFEPREQEELKGLEGRLAASMRGTLWISAEGHHLARARVRTVRPVPVVLLLFGIRSLEVELDSGPAGDGAWLPRRIEVRADARLLGWPMRRHSVFLYWGFAPAA